MQVIEELVDDARDGLLDSAGGRFFGWVIGGGIPVSIAADWLKQLLGLPPQACVLANYGWSVEE